MAGLAVVSVGLYFSADSLRIRDLDFAKAKRQQTESASVPLVSNDDEKATHNDDESEPQQSEAQENSNENIKNNNDDDFSEEPQQSEAQANSNENNNMPITSTSNLSMERSAQDEPEYS
eukprot:CAMPEP_0172418346 /NCGR_PEP_ID=MMETSP1064-20121228/4860_1 /TAXON_ID=202472 /ORGANISM="Aulacoseira subarctica , Strain CCAP 1002/5" /LENGTH=118 /DNA_ID=CAMNT_0013157253 /DNA_START=310 /DNA_END=662 /DNA_ORIENTATION=-